MIRKIFGYIVLGASYFALMFVLFEIKDSRKNEEKAAPLSEAKSSPQEQTSPRKEDKKVEKEVDINKGLSEIRSVLNDDDFFRLLSISELSGECRDVAKLLLLGRLEDKNLEVFNSFSPPNHSSWQLLTGNNESKDPLANTDLVIKDMKKFNKCLKIKCRCILLSQSPLKHASENLKCSDLVIKSCLSNDSNISAKKVISE